MIILFIAIYLNELNIIIIIIIITMDIKNRNKQFVLLGQRPLKVSTSCHLPVIIEEIFEGIGRFSFNHILG